MYLLCGIYWAQSLAPQVLVQPLPVTLGPFFGMGRSSCTSNPCSSQNTKTKNSEFFVLLYAAQDAAGLHSILPHARFCC
jgi:hypothetical protein